MEDGPWSARPSPEVALADEQRPHDRGAQLLWSSRRHEAHDRVGDDLMAGSPAVRIGPRVSQVANTGSLGSRAASPAFVLAQALAARGVRVAPDVRKRLRAIPDSSTDPA